MAIDGDGKHYSVLGKWIEDTPQVKEWHAKLLAQSKGTARVDGKLYAVYLVQEGNAQRVAMAMNLACREELRTIIQENRASAVSSGNTEVA